MDDKQKPAEQTPPPDPQVAPAPGQKVQYVITQASLNGLSGWLLLFLILFIIMSVGEVGLFFDQLDKGVNSAADTLLVVFAPLNAIAFLAVSLLIILRKKIAVKIAYVTLGLFGLYSVLSQLVDTKKSTIAAKAGAVTATVILYALVALYFKQSRRVKETLVK